MTRITFYQNSDKQFTGFDADGHSGYGVEGEDIVCAAISALVINTVNSIEQFTKDKFILDINEETAAIHFQLESAPSHDCLLLLNSLVLGLTGMEDEQYTEFIDIIFEEV